MAAIQKYVDWKVFGASFLVGLVFIYFWGDEKREVNVVPTPENINTFLFKDAAGTCYAYDAKEIPC